METPSGASSSADPSLTYDNTGYEGTAAEDEGGFLPPPMPSPPPQPETQPSHPNWNIPSLSEDAARQAFVEYASDKCCFGSRPAEEGKITNMEAFNTYRVNKSTPVAWQHLGLGTLTNNKEEHTVEQSSGLKMRKLDKVPGNELFKDSRYMVRPVVNFPDPTVVETSKRLVREHQAKYSKTSRILQQRQTIELLPITKVTYEWRGESNVFFVYGRDLKVSAVDYPAACCGCCCSVM
ncbi:protein SSUH2 homolog [Polymixia lowei]